MIDLFRPRMPQTAVAAAVAVLTPDVDGRLFIGQGPRVEEFERQLAPWVATRAVLTLNSCTSAIQLALRLAGVGVGDQVVTTPMTCTATNEPILAAGATPLWADIDPMTGNIDPDSVARRISARTKAILCVDWGGYPCDLDELKKIADHWGIQLIEDAAHAFGAIYRDRPVGSHADFTCFSFQAIKHLTTVDGGALTCRDADQYARGKLLRWYGIDRNTPRTDTRCEDDVKEWGYKFHMNDVTAAIGIEQLKTVGWVIQQHRLRAAYYREQLADTPGVQLLDYRPDRLSSYWLFTVRVKDKPGFIERMKRQGVAASSVHARNDKHTMFRQFSRLLPGVDEFDREQVSIPVGWWLSREDCERVVDAVREAV